MLISHRYRFIYLKTVKRAGTSVEAALQQFCVPEGHGPIPETTPLIETSAGVVGARGRFAQETVWRNHMRAAGLKSRLDPEIWHGYFKFCNIRNPWDKTVSWFHFRHPEMKGRPKAEVVKAFRAWLQGTTGIGRDSRVYIMDGAAVTDDVIRYETMAEDFERIRDILGLPNAEIPQMKSQQRGSGKIPYQDYYNKNMREKVANRYREAIRLFGWTFE
jgi:hypothetical protein